MSSTQAPIIVIGFFGMPDTHLSTPGPVDRCMYARILSIPGCRYTLVILTGRRNLNKLNISKSINRANKLSISVVLFPVYKILSYLCVVPGTKQGCHNIPQIFPVHVCTCVPCSVIVEAFVAMDITDKHGTHTAQNLGNYQQK